MQLELKGYNDPLFIAEHPYFLGRKIWPKWREVMKRFYADPQINELDAIVGMRGGKTWQAGLFGAVEVTRLLMIPNIAEYFGLDKGSEVFVIGVATEEKQASDTIFSSIVSKLKGSPFIEKFSPKYYSLDVYFREKPEVKIICGTSSSASMVGRTIAVIIFDELSRFEQSTSKRGAKLVYESLSRGTSTLGFRGKRIVITSPVHVNDQAMELLGQCDPWLLENYGISNAGNPHMLGVHYPTWEVNPTPHYAFDSEFMKNERAKDLSAFWRDYGAQPYSTIERYFGDESLQRIDAQFEERRPNLLELIAKNGPIVPPENIYCICGDPALKYDAFGLSLAHREDKTLFIDGLYRFKPEGATEIQPSEVRTFLLRVIEKVNHVKFAVFDTWHYPEIQEILRHQGVTVVNHVVKKEEYDKFRNRLFDGTAKVCYYPFLKTEMENLQLLSGLKVDHVKGGSKDVIDACVQQLWAFDELVPKRGMPLRILVGY